MIEEETSTKIVGVIFGNRQALIRNLVEGERLELAREPDNPYDANAVAVMKGKDHLGYIERDLAHGLAWEMDEGARFGVFVSSVTGGGYDSLDNRKRYGANIRIKRSSGKEGHGGR